jgi:tetratricopeptide (TPR) repeat protein
MSSGSPKHALLAGMLVVATALAYFPVLSNGFIWDDDVYVVENSNLGSVEGLRGIWLDLRATPQYYPMVHTTYWIEHRLWQVDPVGYHVVNVLLHALGAILLWQVLMLLGLPGAWFAAAIFALHPVHVESVAWVTERKNVLSGVFYFAALFAYLRSAGVAEDALDEARSRRLYALSLAAFLAALLSKTVTGSLPAVILLLLWWKRGRVGWGDVRLLLPFFVLALSFGLLTVQLETQQVGATGREWDLSFVERVLVAGRAFWFYAGKLLWPFPLAFNYPRWEITASDRAAYLFPLAALAAVALLWLARRRLGRGPLVAVLIFGGTLFPALGFIDVYPMRYSFVADHFQYLASAGLIALFAGVAASATERFVAAKPTVIAMLLLVALGTLTWRQTFVYRDSEALWRDTLAKNPASFLALDSLGVILQERGHVEEAIGYFRESTRVAPDQHVAYNNLGNLLRAQGKLDESERALRRSLEIAPDYVLALVNLGLTQHERGEYINAAAGFRRALQIHPEFAAAHSSLGLTLAATGHTDEAVLAYRAALRADPDLPQAHNNLAALLLERNEYAAAIRHLSRVVELRPDSPEAKRNLRAARKLRSIRNQGAGGPGGG